jgi:hypothetical protein
MHLFDKGLLGSQWCATSRSGGIDSEELDRFGKRNELDDLLTWYVRYLPGRSHVGLKGLGSVLDVLQRGRVLDLYNLEEFGNAMLSVLLDF